MVIYRKLERSTTEHCRGGARANGRRIDGLVTLHEQSKAPRIRSGKASLQPRVLDSLAGRRAIQALHLGLSAHVGQSPLCLRAGRDP